MDPKEVYAEFLKKVERTIYIDNISPDVTESVLKAAFNQFGNVVSVQFIPLSMQVNGIPAALVEMENRKQARDLVHAMETPFMIGGMPRPVRAKPARLEMFGDRPRNPGRQIRCRWLEPRDPKCKVAKKIKEVVKRHAKEDALVLQEQVAEEESLAKEQNRSLKLNYNKLQLIEGISDDGTVQRLKHRYAKGN